MGIEDHRGSVQQRACACQHRARFRFIEWSEGCIELPFARRPSVSILKRTQKLSVGDHCIVALGRIPTARWLFETPKHMRREDLAVGCGRNEWARPVRWNESGDVSVPAETLQRTASAVATPRKHTPGRHGPT